MDQYTNETIGVKLPNGQRAHIRVAVKYTDDDIDIARRQAANFDPGTILTIDGIKFKVVSREPPDAVELKAPKAEPKAVSTDVGTPKSERKPVSVRVGQRWVTKDSRRKQEPFEVIGLGEGFVLTDKGLRIQLHRLNRYKLVS